jgi:hypothetical protein
MASFGRYHSLGFGDPYGDGVAVLAAGQGGTVSFSDLAVVARLNKGWRRQVNAWRGAVKTISLQEIDFDRFGVPRDADKAVYFRRVNELSLAAANPWPQPPNNWCFGEINKTILRRLWTATNADRAMRVILQFYCGLKTLDMRGICVSSDLLLQLPAACPLLTRLDVRGAPAGEIYNPHYSAEPPEPRSEFFHHWRDPTTWMKPCGVTSAVRTRLRFAMPNLKIAVDTITFGISENADDVDGFFSFQVPMHLCLRKVFNRYAATIGVPVDQLRFEHWDEHCEWTIVGGDETPSTVDMHKEWSVDDDDFVDMLRARRLPLPPAPGPPAQGPHDED